VKWQRLAKKVINNLAQATFRLRTARRVVLRVGWFSVEFDDSCQHEKEQGKKDETQSS
jgi:hypothetical protein